MNKQATIKDIAKALKISTSTVSRALQNAPDVNPETKKAILSLSDELNYQERKKPDAIFAISDRMAIGAMLAIKEKGMKMPADIGLIGFNNEPLVSLVSPAISSVEQSAFELGKRAAKLFLEVMHSE